LGHFATETPPDLLLCVADSTNLRIALRLVLELKRVGRPLLLVLNMIDIANRRGIEFDLDRMSEALGVPIVTAAAVRAGGTRDLLRKLDDIAMSAPKACARPAWKAPATSELRAT